METSKRHPQGQGFLATGAIGAAVATAVNIAIYGIGRAAGVDYILTETSRVRVPDVVILSLMSFAIGLVAAAVAARWDRGLRALQVVGAALAVISTWGDFTIDGSGAATATLALMHLVVGAVYVTTLEGVRSRVTTAVVARAPADAVAL